MPGRTSTRDRGRRARALVTVAVLRGRARPHDRAETSRPRTVRFTARRRARDLHRPGRPRGVTGRAPSTAGTSTPPRSTRTRGSRCPASQAENELVVVTATAAYTNSGEGLHRFVDPVDDEVYLYSQFEVPDSRRMYAVFEQPDLKADVRLHGDRARALAGHLQLADARSRSQPRRHRAPGDSRRPPGSPPTSRPSSPDRTTWCRDSLTSDAGEVPLGIFCRRSLDALPRRRQPLRPHQAGLRVLRGRVRLRVPVREVRPDLHAGVQHGRDGERRRRHLHRGLRLPLQGDRVASSSAAPSRCCTSSPTCGSATS